MRVDLVVVAEEDIEPVFLRHAGGAAAADPPLAEAAGGVAGALEVAADGCLAGQQRIETAIVADGRMAAVFAGEQHAAGRRADTRSPQGRVIMRRIDQTLHRHRCNPSH